jgi:Ricin-type beta-trefoil lectin domain-like
MSRPALRARLRLRLLGLPIAGVLALGAVSPAAHADTYYKLAAKHSEMVLDVQNASTDRGAPVIQWYDNGGANQHWALPLDRSAQLGDLASGFVQNQNSGMCLTTDGQAGDQLYQYPCLTLANGDPFPTQDWEVKRVNADGVSWYTDTLTNPTTRLVVDVGGSSYRPGAAVIGWPQNDGDFFNYSLNQVFEQYRA